MVYSLQYQAHVDDLTSLAGNPEDVSWFVSFPPETPRAPAPPLLGATTDDLHSSAATVTDDQSWFATFPYAPAVDRKLGPQGLHAGDLHEAAAEPADVSWFVVFPSRMPLAPEPPVLGFLAADIHSGAATGVVWTDASRAFLYVAANYNDVSFYLEVDIRADTGTLHARLYDLVAAAAVDSSELSTTSATFALVRSDALTLVDGNEYRGQVGVVPGDQGQILGLTLIYE